MDIIAVLQNEFKLKLEQVTATVALIDDGNTIPFIARYRKEVTGSLDDQLLRELADRLTYLRNLEKRKEEVITSIASQEKLTDELSLAITSAITLAEVEDLYRPFKPKRKTRASIALEKGLKPLADIIMAQNNDTVLEIVAENYINEEKEVLTIDEALNGAFDIIAEEISDRADIRKKLRAFIYRTGEVSTKAIDPLAETVYTMYYDYTEPINKIVGHRVLAIDRGERDGILKVNLKVNNEEAIRYIDTAIIKSQNQCGMALQNVSIDSYTRLIFPSLEREIRTMLETTAAEQAIKVFAVNLRQLLMQPPIKGQATLGLDPGFRTGCKVAVVDYIGKVLDTGVIYPTQPVNKVAQAKDTIKQLIEKHNVGVIAIGNGTASRETEAVVAELLHEIKSDVSYVIVSEAGASVYSASKLAAEEFPQFDVSIRSAVSIARRLQDPLAELVKIDPKAIGVGQYQHDMPKARLDEALGGVVEACVNTVGVDLNTASYALLSHISGINKTIAKNIVVFREENGAFTTRKQLMKVPKLGAKAFTQCAGFLRVSGDNFLDSTSVHPESYKAAESIIKLLGYSMIQVKRGSITDIKERASSELDRLCVETGVGIPTICDIIDEMLKPGRDPRDELPKPILRTDVLDLKDIKVGMELRGTVRNVIDFGAFIDIGVHEDGLVHISQICDRYIKHPLDVLNVGDIVTVWVLEVDMKRKRIALTMKKPK